MLFVRAGLIYIRTHERNVIRTASYHYAYPCSFLTYFLGEDTCLQIYTRYVIPTRKRTMLFTVRIALSKSRATRRM